MLVEKQKTIFPFPLPPSPWSHFVLDRYHFNTCLIHTVAKENAQEEQRQAGRQEQEQQGATLTRTRTQLQSVDY